MERKSSRRPSPSAEEMKRDEISLAEIMDHFLVKVEELHSSPAVIWRVLQLLKDPDFDVRDVELLLEADPALSAAILRLVNSSAYGLPQKITSLRQAILLLGARSLRLAVLSFGLVDRLTKGTPAKVYEDFWRRALTTASTASRLAKTYGTTNADEAYCAGLLAELGVLVLAQVDTRRYTRVYLTHRHGEDLCPAEQARYAFDHATLGERLLVRWGLPQPLAQVAGSHHRPDGEPEALHTVVHAGALLSDVLWMPQSVLLPHARQWLADHFHIDLDGFITLAMDCKQDILDNAEMFSIHLEGRIDIDLLRREAQRQFKQVALETSLEYDAMTAVLNQEMDF
ncbi:MAG: HDOD domain-containing protein [Thermogutta sp.]